MARRPKNKRKNEEPIKSTDAEIEQRVNKVYKYLLQGLSRADIIQHAAKTLKWELSDRQIDEYIARAREQIKEHGKMERDEAYSMAVEQVRYLYSQLMLTQDFKGALQALKESNELQGLYPAKKIEHAGKDGKPLEVKFTSVRVTKQQGDE